MSLLRRKSSEAAAATVEVDNADALDELQSDNDAEREAAIAAGRTPAKGRPTPSRRESERRRGPIAPPPRSQREAAKRAKQERGPKLSKSERREAAARRRERMMSGDDAYLMPRDKGAVRAYVRDRVDTRRNLAGLLLPIAVLSFVTIAMPSPVIQQFGPLILMVMILAAVIDSYIFGRRLSRDVRIRFPKGDKSGQSTKGSALGFYAFNRACLVRKWRIPRPQVDRGDEVD